jgi:hypothetical protein
MIKCVIGSICGKVMAVVSSLTSGSDASLRQVSAIDRLLVYPTQLTRLAITPLAINRHFFRMARVCEQVPSKQTPRTFRPVENANGGFMSAGFFHRGRA